MSRNQSGHRGGREKKKARTRRPGRKSKPPSIPAGAITADPNKQVYGLGGPRTYYQDEERVCVQCRDSFVFSASEQKYWYETLRFIVYSTAIRCPKCRRQRRSTAAVERQLAAARRVLDERPDDGLAHLALAEALVQHYDRLGTGRLEDAVAACRKAARLEPALHEALYWEAACQDRLGRASKAHGLYQQFLEHAAPLVRCSTLVHRARRLLGGSS